MKIVLVFAMASLSMVSAYPYAQLAPGPAGLAYPTQAPDPAGLANGHFQYTNVAAPDVFEWGYRPGNDPQWATGQGLRVD